MRSIEPTRKETELIQLLHQILPAESIRSRLIDRISFAADAGFYHLIPIAILQPATEAEIEKIFRFSQQHKIPVTFRTGGTSLSGQAVTDGLLVDLSKYWLKIAPVNDGNSVLVQPGAIGAVVNNRLKSLCTQNRA
ncbi:MAG: FAD-binding protein [Chitinophagaceae bacterium]|nr:FAD-binding protein [Chitinophagaceae bacterium]